jgi:hypothetical protein
MSKINTPVAFVKFNNAKVTHAVAMTPKQDSLFARGVELGADDGQNALNWAEALKLARVGTDDRKVLRAGFVHGLAPEAAEGTKAYKSAQNRFDYLARQYSPHTSRKSASTKETRGRKEKAAATVSKLSEKDVAARLVAVLAFVAEMQGKHAGDGEMLEVLGTVAKLANGATK